MAVEKWKGWSSKNSAGAFEKSYWGKCILTQPHTITKFIYYTIYTFKVYNSVICSIFTELYNRHKDQFENILITTKRNYPHLSPHYLVIPDPGSQHLEDHFCLYIIFWTLVANEMVYGFCDCFFHLLHCFQDPSVLVCVGTSFLTAEWFFVVWTDHILFIHWLINMWPLPPWPLWIVLWFVWTSIFIGAMGA